MLMRTSEGVGINVGMWKLWGVRSVPFARPSSWARMRDNSMLDTSLESGFRPLYDSIINAVTTAEKRPAFKQQRYQL